MIKNLIAQGSIPLGNIRGFGPLGLQGQSGTQAPTTFNTVISTTIAVMTIVAFIWFTIQVFLGAIGIITSGGDKNALESARSKITTGIIGVVVVIAAIFIISLVGQILGINILGGASLIGQIMQP